MARQQLGVAPTNTLDAATKAYADKKEPAIATGTTTQYWRGDKSWQSLNAAAVGIITPAGTIVGTSDTQVLTNKDLSSSTNIFPSAMQTKTVATFNIAGTLGAIAGNKHIYLLQSGAAPTMPTAVGNTSLYSIKNTTTGSITLLTTSGQTIDGSTSILLSPYVSVDIVSDNANWWVL